MSTVFTGESKIFQLAAVNPEVALTPTIVFDVPGNNAVIDGMIKAGFELGVKLAKGCSEDQAKVAINDLFEKADDLTNNFLVAMEKTGAPWHVQYAAWLTYNTMVQGRCAQETARMQQEFFKNNLGH